MIPSGTLPVFADVLTGGACVTQGGPIVLLPQPHALNLRPARRLACTGRSERGLRKHPASLPAHSAYAAEAWSGGLPRDGGEPMAAKRRLVAGICRRGVIPVIRRVTLRPGGRRNCGQSGNGEK